MEGFSFFRKSMACLIVAFVFSSAIASMPAYSAEQLVVFAAASLTESFKEFKTAFEVRHPGVEVMLNLAGSPELRAQIELDAPCDVFASADMTNMLMLQEKGLVDSYKVFASNKMCIIVPKANRAKIRSFKALARPGVKIDGGVEKLPARKYMDRVLDNAVKSPKYGKDFKQKVIRNTIFQEINVKHIVAKVIMGEFDAGIVYITDVTPSVKKDVQVIPIPNDINATAKYPLGVVKSSKSPGLASDFVDLAASRQGYQILKKYGFLKPSGK